MVCFGIPILWECVQEVRKPRVGYHFGGVRPRAQQPQQLHVLCAGVQLSDKVRSAIKRARDADRREAVENRAGDAAAVARDLRAAPALPAALPARGFGIELEALVESDKQTRAAARLLDRSDDADEASDHAPVCPRDGTPLVPMRTAVKPFVECDACTACGGVYLDAGELSAMTDTGFADWIRRLMPGRR